MTILIFVFSILEGSYEFFNKKIQKSRDLGQKIPPLLYLMAWIIIVHHVAWDNCPLNSQPALDIQVQLRIDVWTSHAQCILTGLE